MIPEKLGLGFRITFQGIRRFASLDKGLRSKAKAGKLWVKAGVGASPQGDRPSRPEPRAASVAKRIPYVKRRLSLTFFQVFWCLTTHTLKLSDMYARLDTPFKGIFVKKFYLFFSSTSFFY